MKTFDFIYKTKMDYAKEPRKQVTTTINKQLLKKFQQLSISIDQPTSKMYDVLLMELFENENKLNQFIEKVNEY